MATAPLLANNASSMTSSVLVVHATSGLVCTHVGAGKSGVRIHQQSCNDKAHSQTVPL